MKRNEKIAVLFLGILVLVCALLFQKPEHNNMGSPVADYAFRTQELLETHYYKHGKEMGFEDAQSYEEAASRVIIDPESLHKTQDDGDDVYYLESTNEFVVVSEDGYIRTYFSPDSGKRYYDRQ